MSISISTKCCLLLLIVTISVSCTREKPNEKAVISDSLTIINTADTARVGKLIRNATPLIRNNPDSALFLGRKAEKISTRLAYPEGLADAYQIMASSLFFKYDYDSAYFYYTLAYQICQEINDQIGMGRAQHGLSYVYSLTSEIDKAITAMKKSKEHFEKAEFHLGIYDCLNGLVYYQKQLNNNQERARYLDELIETADKSGIKKNMANSYILLGNYYVDQANMNAAIEAYFKALSISEESGDSLEIAYAIGSIGLANYYLQNYNDAIRYYRRREKILLNLDDKYELGITYNDLGQAYIALKNYDKALEYHQKALAYRKEIDYKPEISSSLHNIASCYYAMGEKTDLALDLINESMAINKKLDNQAGVAGDLVLSGKLYCRNNRCEKAIIMLEEGLALAKTHNLPDIISEAAEALSNIYAETGSFEKAYKNNILYNEMRDSLMNRENLKRITQLEMQHAFDKKQNETELQHLQEKLVFESQLRRNRLAWIFSVSIGVVLIAFGIFIFYSYRKSQKANKEKEALLKEIHHRVKNNLQIISSLLNLQSGSIHDDFTRAAVKESQSRVKSMALIHQLLYQSEMFTGIDFSKYLEQLMSNLESMYSKPEKNIKCLVSAESIELDIDTAIPLGLITNELASNAYKYAFERRNSGIIEIRFLQKDAGKFVLRISDNGVGFPPDFDPDKSNTLGLKLVQLLTKQIKGKFDLQNKNGSTIEISFRDLVKVTK